MEASPQVSATSLFRTLQESNGISSKPTPATMMILYLCVLGSCMLIPVLYYFRLQRESRRLRDLEDAGIRAALQQSQMNREESRAERRKYQEERHARILDLFTPVKTVLTAEDFCESTGPGEESKMDGSSHAQPQEAENLDETPKVENFSVDISEAMDEEEGGIKDNAGICKETTVAVDDDDAVLIQIPQPGLYVNTEQRGKRKVSGLCSICLTNYTIGSEIVWSSNSACDHVFHLTCIDKWLMKQRDGPLCPCCRRDFVIDPYDIEADQEIIEAVTEVSEPVPSNSDS